MKDCKFDSLGNLKQALTKDYNRVNTKIFATGVVSLKIDIVQDKILMQATHKRIAALRYLNQESSSISDLADYYLLESFKRELRKLLLDEYGWNIVSIFKDYDAQSELALTVILLNDAVETYIG